MYEQAIGKFKRWLSGEKSDARSPRAVDPEVLVHYWDGSAPGRRQLRDLSHSGAYIYTTERWYPGTIIRIVLQGQRTIAQEDGTRVPIASACVSARIVRHGSDGVAVEFEFRNEEERTGFGTFLAAIPPRPAKSPDAGSELS